MPKCLARDQQIIFTDRPADGFQLRTNLTRKSGILSFKWQQCDRAGKKIVKNPGVGIAPLTFANSIPKFENGD